MTLHKKRSPPPKGYERYPPQHNQGFQSKDEAMTFSKAANASQLKKGEIVYVAIDEQLDKKFVHQFYIRAS